MTANEAFEILIKSTGAVTANRETHVKIQEALDVIKALIEKSSE